MRRETFTMSLGFLLGQGLFIHVYLLSITQTKNVYVHYIFFSDISFS